MAKGYSYMNDKYYKKTKTAARKSGGGGSLAKFQIKSGKTQRATGGSGG